MIATLEREELQTQEFRLDARWSLKGNLSMHSSQCQPPFVRPRMVLVWSPMGFPTEKQKCLTYIGRINGQSVSGGKSGGIPERHEVSNHPAACFSFGAVDLWRQQTSRGWTGLSALVSAVCICTNGVE
jgi:hypothetical protein